MMTNWISAPDALARNQAARPRLVVTGADGTAKTEIARMLARLTGIPRLIAQPTASPMLPPNWFLATPMIEQGLQLLLNHHLRRAAQELSMVHGFIAESTPLFDWVGADALTRGRWTSLSSMRWLAPYGCGRKLQDSLLRALKRHAAESYQGVIHLPVEFGRAADPAVAVQRRRVDRALVGLYGELSLPYRIIRGTLTERLQQVMDHYRLYPVMAIGSAIEWAVQDGHPGTQ